MLRHLHQTIIAITYIHIAISSKPHDISICKKSTHLKHQAFFIHDIRCISAPYHHDFNTNICNVWREQMVLSGNTFVSCLQLNTSNCELLWKCSPAAIKVKYVHQNIIIRYKIHINNLEMYTIDAIVTIPHILVRTFFEYTIIYLITVIAIICYIFITYAFIDYIEFKKIYCFLLTILAVCIYDAYGSYYNWNHTYSLDSHLSR
jgi:hypothetical protein